MHIFFCDICGVRVTDVDLRGGHGLRRRHHVICPTCLDLGHGKEWLERHRQRHHAVAAFDGTPSGAVALAEPEIPDFIPEPRETPAVVDHPLIAAARDRARTLDYDELKPPRPAAIIGSSATELVDDNDTARVPVVAGDLAMAASGFAALSSNKPLPDQSEAEDLAETPDATVPDDSGAAMSLGEGLPPRDEADCMDTAIDAPEASSASKMKPISEETDPAGVVVPTTKPSLDRQTPKGRKSSSTTGKHSKTAKSGKISKSSAAIAAKVRASQMRFMIIGSAISLFVIVCAGGYMVYQKSHKVNRTGGGTITEDISAELKEKVASAKRNAAAAHNTKDVTKLRAAIAEIDRLSELANKFERIAKENGYTDDDVNTSLSRAGLYDAKGLRITLSQDLSVIGGGSSH